MSISFKINKKRVGIKYPTYFIADIAANHDGSLNKAIDLINVAKESGADAAKFQHFNASTIVSDKTFKEMRSKLSHQKKWKKTVYQVYMDASLDLNWTAKLKKECDRIGIDFFTAPYSLELIDHVDKYVCAYKVGSGDITWLESIEKMSKKKKPLILATGASNLNDVKRAVECIYKSNKKLCIMQCNTNYTGSSENFKFINLNVLKTYRKFFPKAILGLSDHTPGHATTLGAISLGARIVEKHLTISNKLNGPDHQFSMTPKTWKEMVVRSRELELALGSEEKKVETNEIQTYLVQRRSIHFAKYIKKNTIIKKSDLIFLRPYLKNSIHPFEYKKLIGKKTLKSHKKGEIILWKNLK
jgi:sialic acid synthase SpsE